MKGGKDIEIYYGEGKKEEEKKMRRPKTQVPAVACWIAFGNAVNAVLGFAPGGDK